MDGYLVAGLVLLVCALAGCSSYLDTAIRTANVAGTTAIAAHDEIRVLCVAAEEHADTVEKANVVIETCAKAEDAYGVFRAAWLALASALRMAELTGDMPANIPALVAEVQRAAMAVEDAITKIRGLA